MKNKNQDTNSAQKNPKLYYVHEGLFKIIGGFPLRKPHQYHEHQSFNKRRTKFGDICGGFLQFHLVDDPGKEFPEVLVCVGWECDNLYATREEAVEALGKIIDEVIGNKTKSISRRAHELANMQHEIDEIKLEIQGLNSRKEKLHED